MTEMDAGQTLEYNKEQMGEEFGIVFYKLNNVWSYALIKSQEFRLLYSDRENLELINAIGGRFLQAFKMYCMTTYFYS